MLARTHIISSLAIGTIPLSFGIVEMELSTLQFYLIGLFFGSIFPDIDEPNSFIGRKTLVLSHIIKMIFSHRGITHQLIFPMTIFALLSIFMKGHEPTLIFFIFGVVVGIFLHQMGDMLSGDPINKGGINAYFFPFGSQGRIQIFPKPFRCVVGSIKEYIYLFFFMILLLFNLAIIFQKVLTWL